MRIQIIQVPYDAGHRSVRMGSGPEHFVRNGVGEALRGNGHEVYFEVVDATGPFKAEIGTAFELHKLVADRVRDAVEQGRFPLILSGSIRGLQYLRGDDNGARPPRARGNLV